MINSIDKKINEDRIEEIIEEAEHLMKDNVNGITFDIIKRYNYEIRKNSLYANYIKNGKTYKISIEVSK
jgi:hypothetical protein